MVEQSNDRWIEALAAGARRDVAWPPTPELRTRVLAAIDARRATPASPRVGLRRALGITAAALLVAVALTAAIAPARTAVAEFLGLVEGEQIEVFPTPVPGAQATPFPPPLELDEFATRVTMEQAAAAVGFELALPEALGDLLGVYLLDDVPGVAVLHYADVDLSQSRGDNFVGKGVPEDLILEALLVNEHPAYWIEGGSHIVSYFDANGVEIAGTRRTVDRNTLIWRGADTFYRMETDVPLDQALAIAESLP